MKEYAMATAILAAGNGMNHAAVTALANYTPVLNETAQNMTHALQTYPQNDPHLGYGAVVALIGLSAVAFLVVRRH